MNIKISIITVCKNSELYLNETIRSVVNQSYKHIEYIVIDGASTDSTIDIIKANAVYLSYWISEPDKGMYDAINKGLKIATGDYILVLNSDDILIDEFVIQNVVDKIRVEKLDYYYGNIVKLKGLQSLKTKLFKVDYEQLLYSTHCTFIPHPCFFISARLNTLLGGYDTYFKYASDYDYILRALKTPGVKGKHIQLFVTSFRIHDNSITSSGKIDKERLEILSNHGYYKRHKLKRFIYYYFLWIYYKVINQK